LVVLKLLLSLHHNNKQIEIMTNQMIETVQNRVKEMMQDAKIVELYNSFENEEQGQEYIIKCAIATLVGVN
jgi:hypothetical protein